MSISDHDLFHQIERPRKPKRRIEGCTIRLSGNVKSSSLKTRLRSSFPPALGIKKKTARGLVQPGLAVSLIM